MKFFTRKIVIPSDLNANNTLFGGKVLSWVDSESAIFAACQLETRNIVTKYISEVNFVSPATQGDIVEIGVAVVKFGTTSITLCCEVRNKATKKTIVAIDSLVFVAVDANGKPTPHGKKEILLDEESARN
jgi:acyl-CoA thioesterase YciA